MKGVREMAGSRQIKSLLLLNCFPCHLSNYYPFSTLPHRPEHVISELKSVPFNSSKPKVLSRMNEIHQSLAPANCFSFIPFIYLDLSEHIPLFLQTLCKAQCAQDLCPCSSICWHVPLPCPPGSFLTLLLTESAQMSPSLMTQVLE